MVEFGAADEEEEAEDNCGYRGEGPQEPEKLVYLTLFLFVGLGPRNRRARLDA